ncbi:dihydrolipoamide acetyltransferase family protein [Immundisolibacter sp.]|uniref:dihydrolipoamide acetyltransferase family protein n=1 Tax=Immundisolibacter sp. TaxID=1934948 RepID=UPI00356A834C
MNEPAKVFALPDLGEGLAEAELLSWHVGPGDHVVEGQPLVSVETDKAVVEVPSPRTGEIERLCAEVGARVEVGAPLVEFVGGASADAGTVVGNVAAGSAVLDETPQSVGRPAVGIRATPAVRALAKRLGVDLGSVTPGGPNNTIIKTDVERVARIYAETGPLEPLTGTRRAMAVNMAKTQAEVATAALFEDADIHAWASGSDPMTRLLRALVAGCQAEPALNAWFDSEDMGRRLLKKIDVGIAVDSPEGLFVPVLRDAASKSAKQLRTALDALMAAVGTRSLKPEQMRGASIMLSNFGPLGGRYAVPLLVPPVVAILGAGRARDQVLAVDGQPAVRRVLPLSLSFDHRVVTGGEAARFLMAVKGDLEQAA